MIPTPLSVGLYLCEQAVIDRSSENPSLINIFSKLPVRTIPSERKNLVVFATLTDSEGSGTMRLRCFHQESKRLVYDRPFSVRLPDRLVQHEILEAILKAKVEKVDFSKVAADEIGMEARASTREDPIKDEKLRKRVDEVLGKDGYLASFGTKESPVVRVLLMRPRDGKPAVVGGSFSVAFLISNKLSDSARAIVEKAEQIELLSLDPAFLKELPKNAFGRWRVLGQTVVKDAELRKKILAGLDKGAEESNGEVALCFNPRHGLRATHAGKTVELSICFECFQVQVYVGDKREGYLTSGSPEKLLDKILTDAKVPLAEKSRKRLR